jgi:acetylornithine/succinyldiaminopimelate/putrescine aminotransferase
MNTRPPLADTYEQILQEQLPNLLRLYLNPYVTQVCFCLANYVRTTWATADKYQTFLANGFDEALSGAIKLARYSASLAGRSTAGLILDPRNRLGPYAGAAAAGGAWVEFVPGLVVVGKGSVSEDAFAPARRFGLLVLVGCAGATLDVYADEARELVRRDNPLVITCVDRTSLSDLRHGFAGPLRELKPDLVVFDESLVDRHVPFGAFTARKALYDHWNRPGKATFHSTTYQPNTISSLHFLNCLAKSDPEFHAGLMPNLQKIHTDLRVRGELFRDLYSPALYRLIRATGFNTADIRAAGDFVHVNGGPIFDAVSGVACSIRGHNPASYGAEMDEMGRLPDCEADLAANLRRLTGLEHLLPAVSGATAVENALKVALVAQFPRRHILALKAGFGGKTLLALTGTAHPVYKEHIGPLYADVLYVDPFSPDAETRIEAVLQQYPVAVVQVELIQAVGGVRRIPERVIRYLEQRRQQAGYLLLVDEVQTGMFRTGPFTASGAMGLSPDLLLLGKGTSDMMFPFALVLYSAAVGQKLLRAGSDLPARLRERYSYDFGYRTVSNVLRRAEEQSLSRRVSESGELVARLLSQGLAGCKAVRAVRVYGLLIGIELDGERWARRWFRKRLSSLYLFSMLQHRRFPVLAGFCQCEPNVLKITPALTVAEGEIRAMCATVTEVLRIPFYRVLSAALGGLLRPPGVRSTKHEHVNVRVDEPVGS